MEKDPQALFQTLLQQIQLSPNEKEAVFLDNGEVKSVKVYRNEGKWEFYLLLDNILPFQ